MMDETELCMLNVSSLLCSTLCTSEHINNNNNSFTALCPGLPGWAGTRRNIHPLTPILIINYPLSSASSIYYNNSILHPACSIYVLLLVQFTCLKVFLHNLSPRPLSSTGYLCLEPSTSYTIHFFTQSLSSFHNTCGCLYHHSLFCCSAEIMSCITSLYLNSFLRTLSLTSHTHTHTHNRFTALLKFVRDHLGEQVPER